MPSMKQVWPLLSPEHSDDFIEFMETRFGLDARATEAVEALPPAPEAS
jgi:hypothetical protein